MTMQAAIHGRLGKDPQPIATKTGTPMASASVAVDVSARDQEAVLWVRITAFGRTAEDLLRHQKGDMVSAAGRLELQRWTSNDGTQREQWQMVADALVSARTVRPRGGKPRTESRGPARAEAVPFDDRLDF